MQFSYGRGHLASRGPGFRPQHCLNQLLKSEIPAGESRRAKFKVSFSYLVSSRLVWGTRDPISNTRASETSQQVKAPGRVCEHEFNPQVSLKVRRENRQGVL